MMGPESSRTFRAAISVLVDRTMARRSPNDPDGYRRKVLAQKRTDLAERAEVLLGIHPDLTAVELADRLEPPPPPKVPPAPNPSAGLPVFVADEWEPLDPIAVERAKTRLSAIRAALEAET